MVSHLLLLLMVLASLATTSITLMTDSNGEPDFYLCRNIGSDGAYKINNALENPNFAEDTIALNDLKREFNSDSALMKFLNYICGRKVADNRPRWASVIRWKRDVKNANETQSS
nr:uncharacterized protein LOC107449183 [Parasteatoda tepidariorum]